MKNANTTNRFTLDIPNRVIVGSKASFDKAGKGQGPVYDELARLMALHPNFGFEVKVPEQRSAKPKQTYKGMDIPFMLDYASAVGEADFRQKMELVERFAKNADKKVYPIVKRLFLTHYAPGETERFAYEKAKAIVRNYRFEGIITGATSHIVSVDDPNSNETLDDVA